jgi:alpha-glucosidase
MGLGRDPERTPMQWDSSPNAGFAPPASTPWLPLSGDAPHVNVSAQREDRRSMLTLYHRLIQLRRAEPALSIGAKQMLNTDGDGDLVAYIRRGEGKRFLIVLNFASRAHDFRLPENAARGRLAISTHLDRDGESIDGTIRLCADEGVIVELPQAAIG